MRQLRRPGSGRIASWAERSLWALGLSLVAFWGWHQAALRFEQARLEKRYFDEASAESHPDAGAHDHVAELASSAAGVPPTLAPGSPLALIEIPRVGVRAMVVEGVDGKSLRRAVGHIPGTSLPGMAGNVVLAAHRDTLFAGLRDIALGDRIAVKTDRQSYTYRVGSIDVVAPTAVEVMDPTAESVLTLITCFPFDFVGPAPMRFVVRAELLGAPPPAALQAEDDSRSPEPIRDQPVRPRAGRRPLDPQVLSFLSGSLVKPGAN